METSLTKKDLDDHFLKTKDTNDQLSDLLKETAVQFNTIANHLLNLAKSTDTLINSQKESQQTIVSNFEKSSQQIVKDLSVNCDKCMMCIDSSKTEINSLHELVMHNSNKLGKLKETVDKYENDRIKSNTKFTIITSIVGGVLVLVTVLIKFFGGI